MRFSLAALLLFTAAAVAGEPDYVSRRIDVVHADADVSVVASDLAAKAGVPIVMTPEAYARRARVTIELRGVEWGRALRHLASVANLRVSGEWDRIALEDRPRPAGVTLAVGGANLRTLVADVVRVSRFSVVVAPCVQGTLDATFRDEPWPKALVSILRPRGYHAVLRGELLLVTDSVAPGEVELGEEEPDPPIAWPSFEQQEKIDIDVEEARLADLVAAVSARVKRPIVVGREVAGVRVTVALREIGWRDAVEVIARMTRCELREEAGVVLVHRAGRADLVAEGDAATVLASVAAASGRNLLLSTDVSGAVLVELRHASWIGAVAAIASACRVEAATLGGEVTVLSRSAGPALRETTLVDGLEEGFTPEERASAPIDVVVDEADLRDVVEELSARAGRPIFLAPDVQEKVTGTFTRLRWRTVLELLARQARGRVVRLAGSLLVEQPPRVTIQFDDANVRTVLLLLAAYSGKNVLIAPDVAGTVTTALSEVTWSTALEAIALASGLHVTPIANDVLLVSTTPHEPWREPASWRSANDRPGVVSLELEEADLAHAVAALTSRCGTPVVVAHDVHEKVTATIPGMDWRDALDVLAVFARCDVARTTSCLVVEQPPRITLQATDVSARSWFDLLARSLGVPVTVAPDVAATFTLDLREVGYETAFRVTTEAAGLRLTRDGTGFEVTRGERAVAARPRVVAKRPAAPAPAEPPPLTEKEKLDLEARIDAVFIQIEELIRSKEIDKLAPSFEELAKLTRERPARELARRTLAAWQKRLDEWKEVRLAVQLQLDIAEGNDLLGEMLRDRQRERYDLVAATFLQLKAHVRRMRDEERDEFRSNAEAIEIRGKALADVAAKLDRIRTQLPVSVRAIVVDPREGFRNRAVVALGGVERIYSEEEQLLDPAGQSTKARVVKVQEGTVRFRFEDTEFVRELESPGD